MSGFAAIVKREIRSYFTSPIGYVFFLVFIFICGYFFYRSFIYFSLLSLQAEYGRAGETILNLQQAVFQPLFSNFIFAMLFAVPLITMRLFSEEMKTGTLELLLSYPVQYIEVILAKMAAAVVFFAVALSLTGLFPLIAAIFGNPEVAPILTAYLGLGFTGVSFVCVGMFFSSVTENQIIAAIATFGVLLFLWAIGWTASFVPGALGRIMSGISIYNHFSEFNRGVINTNDMLYYMNLAVFFVVLTLTHLQARAWKS